MQSTFTLRKDELNMDFFDRLEKDVFRKNIEHHRKRQQNRRAG